MSKHQASRRAVLTGAAGVAAAGALSTMALALPSNAAAFQPSPELLAWRKARPAYWLACDRQHEWFVAQVNQHGSRSLNGEALIEAICKTSEYRVLQQACEDTETALDASVEVLLKRPVRSWHDVAELAEMVRGEHRWFPGERDEDDDNAPHPDVTALFEAIEMMVAKGGTNV